MLLKEKKMVELNRRTFLSGSVAAGAVALFGTEAAHAAGAVKLPAKWDETWGKSANLKVAGWWGLPVARKNAAMLPRC